MVVVPFVHWLRKARPGDAPRRRLHRSTYVVLLAVAAALVLANVPGQEEFRVISSIGRGSRFGDWDYRLEHGWPFVYLQRAPLQSRDWVEVTDVIPWQMTADVLAFSPAVLSANVVVAAGVLLLAAWLYERWRCRRHRVWQFHIVDFAGVCALVGIACAWWVGRTREHRQQVAALAAISESFSGGWRLGGPTWLRCLTAMKPVRITMGLPYSGSNGLETWSVPDPREHWLAPLDYVFAIAIIESVPDVDQKAYDAALESIAEVPRLESLTLPRLGRREWECLARCPRLRRLVLEFDETVDVSDLRALPTIDTLESLDWRIDARGQQGLAILSKFPSLKSLRLCFGADVHLTQADFKMLARLSDLRVLGVYSPITDREVGALTALSKLEVLDLPGTNVSDVGVESLASLHRLRELRLDDTAVTDRCIPTLARFQRLELLNIASEGLTDRGKAELRRLLPKCDVVTDQQAPPSENSGK